MQILWKRRLYNTVLDGISLEGNSFFYVNPLEVWPEACEKNPSKHHVKTYRQKWFGVACCPPNITRTLASLGQYIYLRNNNEIFINLYVGSNAAFDFNGQLMQVKQQTSYPWGESIRISVIPQNFIDFTLALRIPTWCPKALVKVNGKEFDVCSNITEGYVKIKRFWNRGDIVELELSMPVMLMQSNPNVRANAGRVAIQRGPLVYCLEEIDNGRNLQAISIPEGIELTAEFDKDLLGGIMVIKGKAECIDDSTWTADELYRPLKNKTMPINIKAIPYCLWNNRKPGEMLVWIRYK